MDPAETNGYLEFTECSFHLHLPVLMNRSEASPSVAESHREEMGGVKEGVNLYKYQFNSNSSLMDLLSLVNSLCNLWPW